MKKYKAKFNREQQTAIASVFGYGTKSDIEQALQELIPQLNQSVRTYGYFANKLLKFIIDIDSNSINSRSNLKLKNINQARFLRYLPFKVFGLGNGKLPFHTFSTLALSTCPFKGACAEYCYTLNGWRNPAAFFRQAFNTYTIRFYPHIIAGSFQLLPRNSTLRLYVDGDFDSLQTLRFWMNLLKDRPDVKAYGYSKSLAFFDQLGQSYDWPSNYQLNISSGGVSTQELIEKVKILPVCRGEFLSLDAGKDGADYKENSKPYRQAVRKAAKAQGINRLFVCPGNCGSCLPNGGHACGVPEFKNITIAIGIH